MPAREQRIGASAPGETDFGTLVARTADRDRRRQESHRAEERDQHSGAGDQPKLGHAAESRRHERQKARRCGQCCNEDGASRTTCGQPQRFRQVAGIVLGLAEADRKLKAEVHGDAHEQHTEPDRNQIERADRRRCEQQRQHQAKAKCSEDRHDQPPASNRESEPERDQCHAADQPRDGALGDRRELGVGERHRSGDAHMRRAALHERQLRRCRANRRGRRPAWLERLVIEPRLGQYELILAPEIAEPAAQHLLPRQRLRMARDGRRHRGVERAQLIRIGRKVRVAVRHSLSQQPERGEQATRCRIGGQRAEERLRIDGAVQQVRELGRREEQQRFLRQVRRGAGLAHHAEIRVVRSERTREIARRLLGLFRHFRVDHRDQQALELRKGAIQRHGTLPPGQRRGEHLVGVGVHAEMVARIQAGANGEQDAGEHHGPGVPPARIDEPDKRALEQGRAGTGAAHPAVPPERLATLCSRPATSAGVPPELSSPRKSERCTATRLIEPSVSTSTACQPAGPRRMT